jgi:hypothetical protein
LPKGAWLDFLSKLSDESGMNPNFTKPLAFCLLALAGLPLANNGQIQLGAPLQDFTIPGFGDDGFPTWILKGKQLQHVDDANAEVQKMRLQILAGKGSREVETDLYSPTARVHLRENMAHGTQSLSILGDHFQITGREWQWDGNSRTVKILHSVKVTFDENLQFF